MYRPPQTKPFYTNAEHIHLEEDEKCSKSSIDQNSLIQNRDEGIVSRDEVFSVVFLQIRGCGGERQWAGAMEACESVQLHHTERMRRVSGDLWPARGVLRQSQSRRRALTVPLEREHTQIQTHERQWVTDELTNTEVCLSLLITAFTDTAVWGFPCTYSRDLINDCWTSPLQDVVTD